jgi:hypothetical protein
MMRDAKGHVTSWNLLPCSCEVLHCKNCHVTAIVPHQEENETYAEFRQRWYEQTGIVFHEECSANVAGSVNSDGRRIPS